MFFLLAKTKSFSVSSIVGCIILPLIISFSYAEIAYGAADNAPPGVADEPTEKVKPDVTTGDPVSVTTGAVAFECADVLVRCPGVDLAFRRYYNSRFPHAEGLPLGEGWRDNWDLRLVCLTRGVTVTGVSGPVTVTPDGAAVTNRPVHAEVALSRSVLLYLPDGDVAEFSGRN
ncbi:MAG: hypothetical protein IJU44_12000, partial [Kiritimatiellae bacterium]|nr:hypothetical protein [Kiritimatiellia bacterium]